MMIVIKSALFGDLGVKGISKAHATDDVDKDGIYKAFVHFSLIDDVLNLC